MDQFYPFILIVFSGVFFSMLSIRTHIPWAVMLIIGGVLLGPSVFNIVPQEMNVLTGEMGINSTLDFLGQIGLIFLMFMAGLETKFSQFREFQKSLGLLAFINGFIPFLAGVTVVTLLGYDLITALIVGVIFVSSSVAVVIPSLEVSGMLRTKLGQSVIVTTVLQDITSLVLLSFLLQSVSPVTDVPLYVFYPVLFGSLIALRLLIPKLRTWVVQMATGSPDLFQLEFRSTFLMLIGTVIAFELLGLHPIVAGFFSGLVLADSITSKRLKEKIQTISYGVFIPTFFIVVGLQTDLSVFQNIGSVLLVVLVVVATLVISKYSSGYIAARMVGFSKIESNFFAATSLPQLSTTLATAFVAFNLGLLDQVLLTSLVLLSVITVLISPLIIRRQSTRLAVEKIKT